MAKKSKLETYEEKERDVAVEIRDMVEDAIQKARDAESADSHGSLRKAEQFNMEVDDLVSVIFDTLRSEGL